MRRVMPGAARLSRSVPAPMNRVYDAMARTVPSRKVAK